MENRLKSLLNLPAVITVTDNTSSMISVMRRDQGYHVRLNRIFLDADEMILKAVAEFISGNSKHAKGTIKRFINEQSSRIRRKAAPVPKKIKVTHQGRCFNLMDSFETLNCRYFEGGIDCRITWGRRLRRARFKSIRLGSYSSSAKMIRINPMLDREFVPVYVLESIIYHEMLHSLLGFKYVEGRRLSHYAEFRSLEKRFLHWREAKAWIKINLNLLMRKIVV